MTAREPLYSSIGELLETEEFAGRLAIDIVGEIQTLYRGDDKPWVIGFSGGKDSTTVLSLIYTALRGLNPKERHKHVYVVSSDTLVETPGVVDMIDGTIDKVNASAKKHRLPLTAHKVVPKSDDTFWVNLLGKGYPAPTRSFRWCTERMKIDPVTEFILDKVARFGEVIVVLGARSDESSTRAQVMAKHKIEGSKFSRHSSLPGAFTYMPIEDWNFDEVWLYLLGAVAPWGGDHFELFDLYKGSNAGECPLVIDTKTPSCGNSRFGCWTCTVVTKDRAMEGLIESGASWMQQLKDFRDMLYATTDPKKKSEFRNFKRRSGQVTFNNLWSSNGEDKHILGPYWIKYRKIWLRQLLEIQQSLREHGQDITLIQEPELHAIRREWLYDPNEPDWSDSLPTIYQETTGRDLNWVRDRSNTFGEQDEIILKELESKHDVPAELIMKLIELEFSIDGLGKRKGFLSKIESLLQREWDSFEKIIEKRALNASDSTYDEKLSALAKEYEALH